MDNAANLRKLFLYLLVASLAVSGLMGIFIFLFSDFGDTQVKLLFTTLGIGGCSLTGLCSATLFGKPAFKLFSSFGIVVALLCFGVVVFTIWSEISVFENSWKILVSLIVLTVTLAHISLLLNLNTVNALVKNVLIATVACIAIVSGMLFFMIYGNSDPDDFFYRLLGVFAILDVVGTIVTPILNRTQKQA